MVIYQGFMLIINVNNVVLVIEHALFLNRDALVV